LLAYISIKLIIILNLWAFIQTKGGFRRRISMIVSLFKLKLVNIPIIILAQPCRKAWRTIPLRKKLPDHRCLLKRSLIWMILMRTNKKEPIKSVQAKTINTRRHLLLEYLISAIGMRKHRLENWPRWIQLTTMTLKDTSIMIASRKAL
jgi:hypothetical protein